SPPARRARPANRFRSSVPSRGSQRGPADRSGGGVPDTPIGYESKIGGGGMSSAAVGGMRPERGTVMAGSLPASACSPSADGSNLNHLGISMKRPALAADLPAERARSPPA